MFLFTRPPGYPFGLTFNFSLVGIFLSKPEVLWERRRYLSAEGRRGLLSSLSICSGKSPPSSAFSRSVSWASPAQGAHQGELRPDRGGYTRHSQRILRDLRDLTGSDCYNSMGVSSPLEGGNVKCFHPFLIKTEQKVVPFLSGCFTRVVSPYFCGDFSSEFHSSHLCRAP